MEKDKDKIIAELATAALLLAHWLEGQSPDDKELRQVEKYLRTLDIGESIIQAYENNSLESFLMD
jgi:hypothetical protein